MAEKTYTHKKRIVYTALSPYFSRRKLIQAMILWDKKYAASPSLAIQHFVYDLKNTIDAEADIRNVRLDLVKANALPENKLLEDPSELISEYAKLNRLTITADYSLPELETLELFIRKWQSILSPPQNENIINFMLENIDDLKLDPNLSVYFSGWLQGRKSKIRIPNAKLSDLRKIINLFYVGCCEYLGPVKADELLAYTVNKLKNNGGASYATIINKLI